MNRLAIFVEGYTEIVFVEKLIKEIAGNNNVLIEHRKIRGGSKVKRKVVTVKAANQKTNAQYFILLFDCGGDDQVKTRILEEHKNLTNTGYAAIIGIRDVRPTFTYNDIPRLELNLPRYIKTSLIPVQFILSIMEIEAWFLSEASHFVRINSAITVEKIKAELGFDPENDNMEQRPTPAEDLNNCYLIGGKTYNKQQSGDTVNALDYEFIYFNLSNNMKYMKRLITNIEDFLLSN